MNRKNIPANFPPLKNTIAPFTADKALKVLIVILCVVFTIALFDFFRAGSIKTPELLSPGKLIIVTRERIPDIEQKKKPEGEEENKPTTRMVIPYYKNCQGTVFRFWLADLAGKNQNKLIGEQFFPFFSSNGDCARVSYAVESKLMHSAGRIFFVNPTDKGVMMFEIIYDSAKEKICCGNIRQFPVNSLTFDYNYLYGLDPKQKYIFDTEFQITQIEPFTFFTNLDKTPYSGFTRKYHFIGSISVTDHDKIFIQSDSNDMSLLSYYKKPESQPTHEITFGEALYPKHDILYHPSDFHSDEDKVAFYSYFFQDETTQDSINAWLCTWDLKTNKAEKIIPYRPRLIIRPGSLKWGKGTRQDCVALCAEDYVDIIDTSKHTRIAKLKIGLPVKVCWSPDGSKLAVSSRGEVYCYDLDNKQLITVSNENNDNEGYDCFWVK